MAWTVDSTTTYEAPPTKGSRFLATVAAADTVDAALAVLREVAAQHPRASHHCWALRLADGTTRSNDDGEPSGSAGRPILARLSGRDAADIVVVVSRWFGGTKLGVGGLVRAYGGCAGAALDHATPVQLVIRQTAVFRYPYADTGAVESVLAGFDSIDVDTRYGADVLRSIQLTPEHTASLQLQLVEATGGRLVWIAP